MGDGVLVGSAERAVADPARAPDGAASEELPRQRLRRAGAAGLSDAELVALLLRTGVRGRGALTVSRELLRRHGGLAALARIGSDALGVGGVGPVKAASLLAAFEVGRRLAYGEVPRRDPMTHPAAVATYLRLRFCRNAQEVMGALYLDSRNRLLAERETFVGTLSRAAVEPRSLLKEALERDAAGIILFHTHPSGDPTPSAEDVAFTRRMRQAGDILGVRLVDHLVLGNDGRWASLRRLGGLD